MNKYYQNTFLFISSKKGLLTPLLRALQWATKNRIERLDIPLIRVGLTDKLLKDSRNHLIIDYDIYKHPQTKEYVLRIRTESEGNVNVNIRMYNFDDVQCTVIPSVAYGFVTGMNLQLC